MILCACQQTPIKEPIAGKEDTYEFASQNKVTSQSYAYEKRIDEDVELDDQGLTIHIHADVQVPSLHVFPVVCLVPDSFSQEKTKELIDYFAPNARFFADPYQMTKEQLTDKMILYMQNASQDKEYSDNTEEDRQHILDEYEERIEQAPEVLQREYLSFGEIVDPYTENIIGKDGSGYGVQLESGIEATVCVLNAGDESLTSMLAYSKGGLIQKDEDSGPIGDVAITQEDAAAKAEQVLRDLSINSFTLGWVEKAQLYDRFTTNVITKGYHLIFTRSIDELCTLYIGSSVTIDPDQMPEYVPPWQQEMIEMFVDENGVQSIYWSGLSEIKETVTENAALLPFEDIRHRFVKQLGYKYAWNAKADISIHNIALGLAMIGVKDRLDEAMLVPSWYVLYAYNIGGKDIEDAIVLNAIDGSVIEPRLDAHAFQQ
jgi:hypothetical protein